MTTFQAGKTYTTRSIGDSNCIVSVAVVSRTAKTIKAVTMHGTKTLRIASRDGIESVKPWGAYSMAPTVLAS